MIQIFKNPNFNFIGVRYIAYVISGILVTGGIIAIVQISRGQANLGVDFSGGSVISLKFNEEVEISKIRTILDKNGLQDTSIQQISEAPGLPKIKVLLRIKKSNIKVGQIGEHVEKLVKNELNPPLTFVRDRTEDIGPVVSKKLQSQAAKAVILAMIAITIYIWFRFEFRFGVAASIATIHDVLVVMGVFYFLNKEFSLLIVTALLTIAGYSLTDTVVVFDRIRENLKIKLKESFKEIINLSINEVLNRTVMTSVTTLLAVIALFIWGGEVIRDFSLALLFGFIVGTYSSVFVASPILLEWESAIERKQMIDDNRRSNK